MQCATIEYARDVAKISDANSTEFDQQTPHRVILQIARTAWRGRNVAARCASARGLQLEPGSVRPQGIRQNGNQRRHRHRYEFNREYEKQLIAAGLKITGRTPDENYVEIVEAPEHPWFLGCQFHPEFKSKPLEPHPLFAGIYRRRNRA